MIDSLYDLPVKSLNGRALTVGGDGIIVKRFSPDMTLEEPLLVATIEAALD